MRGGTKLYRGSAAGARQYVEADRSRSDDYYLTEGTGIAQRFTVDRDGHVAELAGMDGDHYEAGVDPETGEPRGRLRTDERGVRFCEVIVNGPKTWSIAAETHPEIAVAYERAQDRAVTSIVSWLGQPSCGVILDPGADFLRTSCGLLADFLRTKCGLDPC